MSDSDGGGAGRREVAYRLFAAEYDDADLSYSEGEEERAPNYVVTPTGARINRTFVVGVLTEVAQVSDDVLRARVVDPTGAFVLYAGQYQPDEQAFLDRAETPTFVAVTGKARTFRPEDGQQVYTSIRPESINEVDADTRDRWTVGSAEQTLQRVGLMAAALRREERGDELEAVLADEGIDEGLASGIALAVDHYGTTGAYLGAVRELALDAARLVAGDVEEVEPLSTRPDASGEADLDALAGVPDLPGLDVDSTPAESGDSSAETGSEPASGTADGGETGSTGEQAGVDSLTDAGDESADIGDFEPGEFELDEAEREEIESEFGTEFQSGTEVDEPGEADIDAPEPDESTAETVSNGDAASTAPGAPPASTADETTNETTDETTADGATVETTDKTTADGATDEATEGTTDETTTEATDEAAAGTGADGDQTATGDAETAVDTGDTTGGGDDEPAGDLGDVDLPDATVEVMGELDDGDGADRAALVETVAERYGATEADVEEAIQDALMDGRCYEPDDATLKPI